MKKSEAWTQVEHGIDYKNSIKLFQTVRENWNFYMGRQWEGCEAPGLPMPVMNIIKPAIRFKTVQVKDRKLTLKFMTDGEAPEVAPFLNVMSDYAKRTWRRLKMENKNLEGLIDAANSGDYILYHWWNTGIETGQPFKGDIDNMLIDSVNYFPGNPNDPDVQSQPYIILVMRMMVDDVKKQAKENKRPAKEIEAIAADEETDYTAGEYGRIELDGEKKCNVLLKMWKEDGEDGRPEVWFAKYTRNAEVQPPRKANLRLYPIAKMRWDTRKDCAFGDAEATYMKANQVYINKQMAFAQFYLLQTAYPKVIYSKTMIPEGWSNKVVGAIGVQGGDVTNVAHYMAPPQMPADVWASIDRVKAMTMELMGVNDAALGNIANPANTSAFIAVRDAAIVPLQAQQERFYQMMRDTGLIWLDMFLSHYDEDRLISIDFEGQPVSMPFDKKPFEDLIYDCDVEVGESQMWSELNVVMTLDNLLAQGKITFPQYLERMPKGYIPDADKLAQDVRALKEQQQQMAAQTAIAMVGPAGGLAAGGTAATGGIPPIEGMPQAGDITAGGMPQAGGMQ